MNVIAELLPNESQRLEALAAANILDTPDEPFFEALVELVRRATGAPVVLVSFVDAKRQWFKAERGMGVKETSRDLSFCAHAILGDEPLVINDARADVRFCDNGLVLNSPFIAAYAGAPITLSTGVRLGTLCCIDHKPRQWSLTEIEALRAGAIMVGAHLRERQARLERDGEGFLKLALAVSEARSKAIIDLVRDGVVIQGRSGAIIDANDAACDILGLTREQILGRKSVDPRWRALTPERQPFDGRDHPISRALQNGECVDDVLMGIVTAVGEERWINVSARPIRRGADVAPDEAVTLFRRHEP